MSTKPKIAKRIAILLALAASAVTAQEVYINDASTLRQITGIFINDASTLREIQAGYINDGGVLRQIYSAADTITLSGTSGAPNTASSNEISPTDAFGEWVFNTDGTVDKNTSSSGVTQFQTGVEWNASQPTPTATYYIRATTDSGDLPTSGSSLTTCHSLAIVRTWRWTETTNGFASTIGTIKVEIATDAGCTNIVATGYYRGSASVEL